MYVGKGLGMRKDAGGRVESQGSVREVQGQRSSTCVYGMVMLINACTVVPPTAQVLAKILADNPEVARLRKLEKNRLGKWAL